jgi:hypothetical protein
VRRKKKRAHAEEKLRSFFANGFEKSAVDPEVRAALHSNVQEAVCRCCAHYRPDDYSRCPYEKSCREETFFTKRKSGPDFGFQMVSVLQAIVKEYK